MGIVLRAAAAIDVQRARDLADEAKAVADSIGDGESRATALAVLDQGARLYPPSRGRRFARLDDRVASAYVGALLARRDPAGEVVRRLKSVVVTCYYELPEVQREIGYDPAPYIAAVSRRRLRSYGPQIRAGEAAVTAPADGEKP